MTDKPSIDLGDDFALDSVHLPARIRNSLTWAGIKTVGEIRKMSDKDLLSLENLGPRSVAYIRQTFGKTL